MVAYENHMHDALRGGSLPKEFSLHDGDCPNRESEPALKVALGPGPWAVENGIDILPETVLHQENINSR